MKKDKITLDDMYDTILFLVSVFSFEHIKVAAVVASEQGMTLKEFAKSLPSREADGTIVFNDWQKDVIVENFTLLHDQLLGRDLTKMVKAVKELLEFLHEILMPNTTRKHTLH